MGSQGRSPRQGLGAVAPVKSPFPGERGQGDRGSELEVCFKNILFLQTERLQCYTVTAFVLLSLTTPRPTQPISKSALSLAMHYILGSLVKGEVLSPGNNRTTTGGIVLRQHNYFNRHNLKRHIAAKAVTAPRRDRHSALSLAQHYILAI